MKAIFYILSILVIGAACYFAYDNKVKLEAEMTKFQELNDERERVNGQTKDTENTLDDTKGSLDKAKDLNLELISTKDNEEAKERSLRATLESVQTRIDEADAKIKQFEEAQELVKEALKGVPVPFNEIPGKIKELEDEKKEKDKRFGELLMLEEKLQASVDANREEISRLVTRMDEIREKIDKNAIAGTVTAVDPVWGFVIVNLGEKNSNITADSNLLVSRSGKLLGRLSVTSLEPNQTICDLDLKALRPGQRIQPGDKVILANTAGQ